MPVLFRIPLPATAVDLEPASNVWQEKDRRRRAEQDSISKISPTTLAIIVIAAGVIVIITAIVIIRAVRRRHPNPKYIPTPFLKRLWTDWKVRGDTSGPRYELSPDDDADWSSGIGSRTPRPSNTVGETQPARQAGTNGNDGRGAAGPSPAAAGGDAGVDRNTSVRSVLTLPAYRIQPTDTEQVLGREGDRGGVDVVVELPTAEIEEAMREDEMDALYQIRQARRRQIAEREDRRQRRRDALERNDQAALAELRRERRSTPSSNAEEVEELRREHSRIKATRQRAVSSVSYHDLGVARADGTRIRANSTESERVGLLSDAASISASAGAASLFHSRDRSASSALSIDTAHSNERSCSPGVATAGAMRSRAGSRVNSGPNTPRLSGVTTRAGSSPEVIDAEDADLGGVEMPPHSPPGYDDVSLNDDDCGDNVSNISAAASPAHSRSGANSPYNEPPPDYPSGPTRARNNRLSAHMADLAADAAAGEEDGPRHERRSSRGVGGVPQLPSLRLNQLPQIVIEPSSARPGDDDGR